MKSPEILAKKIARQWENSALREERMLDAAGAWPIFLPIGKPSAAMVHDKVDVVRAHCDAWRSVKVGEVIWGEAKYRATLDEVRFPARWIIHTSEEWITACADRNIRNQHRQLTDFLTCSDPAFHSLMIRRRSLWKDRATDEVKQALWLAQELEPGCAAGLPLRALPFAGNDTKFFERNESLLLAMLDIRFDGEVSGQGLEAFLGAVSERGHWLLVIDLDGNLLPFEQLRIRSEELARNPLPGSHLLIVENESCLHQLPPLPDTIAVLGSGFDLNWTAAKWLQEKQTSYWGDLDTWGLELLARVRKNHPSIRALLMTLELYSQYQSQAVPEKTPAQEAPHPTLTETEQQLYRHLREQEKGRLEQEFIPSSQVKATLRKWRGI